MKTWVPLLGRILRAAIRQQEVAYRDNPAVPLLGRILLAAIFVQSGVGKVLHPAMTQGYMEKAGMPLAGMFLVLAILAELGGSLSVLLGLLTRWGATVLIIFMIPTTLIFHGHVGEQMQMIMFMKNVSMTGGLLILLANGAGKWSIDERLFPS